AGALETPEGTPKVGEALRPPVDLRQQRDAFGQLVGETLARVEIRVERCRPALVVHRRPAVDESHQVERTTENGGVRAHRDGRSMRHIRAVQRLDDPPLPKYPPVAVGWSAGRRDADHAGFLAAADLVDLVLGAAREKPSLYRLALAGQRGAVHPVGKARNVDHRFPTSRSRYSANLARAASRFFGIHSVGQMSSLGRKSRRTCLPTVVLCPPL